MILWIAAWLLAMPGTSAAEKAWLDITKQFIVNPGFDGNSSEGWTYESGASSQALSYDCMEFWNGWYYLQQQLTGLPKGHYRLSVQAYYRCADNDIDYYDYKSNSQHITGMLFADQGDSRHEQALRSVYSESLDYDAAWNCWSADGRYYPNGMASGSECFGRGMYWNSMEFDAEGDLTIGLYCYEAAGSNWTLFDNFKLEYYGEQVPVSSIALTPEKTEIVMGETIACQATVLPENALIKKLTWTSGNDKVATVDQNGNITGVSRGTATITAAAQDGSGARQAVRITVTRNMATEGSIIINEIMASNVDEYISPAFNFDGWIELYNPTDLPVELAGLVISDEANGEGPWTVPDNSGVVPAKGFKLLWFDSNGIKASNAPFKLDTDGGRLVIEAADGTRLATQDYPPSMERTSYARSEDGGGTWGVTGTPTPEQSNQGISFAQKQLAAPVVDQPSQLFSGSLTINVTIPAGCTLRYTLDGTLPTQTHGYTSTRGQFKTSESKVYRFRLYADGMLPSTVTSRSYILRDRDYTLPVVAVVADPDFLYSTEIGVMAKGPNGRPGNGQSDKCNWNMDWERPVNFSYLTADGEMVLNQDVNLEMCGGWSRAWTPHSFKLKGNKELGGSKDLLYPFFSEKPYIRNRTLQIRNGGNDTWARFKDPSLQHLVQTAGVNVDVQSYQPVHEFINGNYIGVLNVREPNNKHYVYANYGWDDTEIDQFEMSPDSGYVQKCGTPDAYNELVDILSADAANAETYAEIRQLLDVDAYANYMAAETYLGNWDWPQNNVKGFRYRGDGGKFRFVLFDLDGSFNSNSPFNDFMGKEVYTFDELYPRGTGRIREQIRFVTLFKNLLKNDQFRRQFIDTYCLMGGSVFEKSRASKIIDELLERVEPAMNLEWASASGTANDVKNSLNSRLTTANTALRNHSAMKLISSASRYKLSSDAEGAQLTVNGQQVPTGRFDGYLYQPATLKAIAPAGYTFQGWYKQGGDNQILKSGAMWSYYDGGSLDTENWTAPTYSSTKWKTGLSPLGYGKTGVKTTLSYGSDSNNKRPTYYFRATVSLPAEPKAKDVVTMDFTIDDGMVIYVNGTEAGRYNMPSGTVSYKTYASTYAPGNPDHGSIDLPIGLFHEGSNVIAVEVHNNSANSSDIYWDAAISTSVGTVDVDAYSTDAEIELPGSAMNLIACFQPLTPAERQAQGITPVRINEVSGSNDSFIDEYGKKGDWVELYNTTDEEVDVEGMYLTDDVKQPTKYQITKAGTQAQTKIPAHGYLIVWCDKRETTSQGLHASFKISGDGGQIALTAADKSWTDVLTYEAHDANTTIGRFPDGAATVFAMNVPTIGHANLLTSYLTEVKQGDPETNSMKPIASANGFRIRYGSQQLLLKSEDDGTATVDIYTTSGQLVEHATVDIQGGTARLDVSPLSTGFYVARAIRSDGTRVSCKFMK